ncbi:uncharacterized protein [Aquarana catesbeiana]|uniref:uncharacterized protein n=1 Tax=Aquarana catesbeiana TaxID=8400 RepID=UPI003CCA5788
MAAAKSDAVSVSVSDMAATHNEDMEEDVPGPSMEAAAAATSPTPASKNGRRRGTQTATSRKRNLTWTHIESQVLVMETLPCWMQLCGPRSRETIQEWKWEKWEEISRKVEETYRHRHDSTACRKKFSDIKRSIARKRRQLGGGRTGKQVPLLPHEKELLAAVGEDEINQLLAHQDRIQAQRHRRQRVEEQESSTSSTCSVIQSEGETQEEEAEAATPTCQAVSPVG